MKRVCERVDQYNKKNISEILPSILAYSPYPDTNSNLHPSLTHKYKQAVTYAYSVLPFLIFYPPHFLSCTILSYPSSLSFFPLLSPLPNLSPSLPPSLTNTLTHSFTHSLTPSFIHCLTHLMCEGS